MEWWCSLLLTQPILGHNFILRCAWEWLNVQKWKWPVSKSFMIHKQLWQWKWQWFEQNQVDAEVGEVSSMWNVNENDKSYLMTIINLEPCMLSLKVFVFKFVVVFTMSDEFLSFTMWTQFIFGFPYQINICRTRTSVAMSQSFLTFKNRIQLIRWN